MNEQHFAYQVRRHLNQGTAAISPGALERLAMARSNALAHQRIAAHSPILAGVGINFHLDGLRPRRLLGILALVAALSVSLLWHAQEQVAELEELDSALLSDDLPLDAYLDKGFAAWLDENNEE